MGQACLYSSLNRAETISLVLFFPSMNSIMNFFMRAMYGSAKSEPVVKPVMPAQTAACPDLEGGSNPNGLD